jgi:LPXTG-motif cell wall-anchored protein
MFDGSNSFLFLLGALALLAVVGIYFVFVRKKPT